MEQTLTVPATFDALQAISDFVVAHAQASGLDEHAVWEMQLATDEAATNVIQHSYAQGTGDLVVGAAVFDDTLEITLRDRGTPFDPANVPPPDLDSPLEERRTGGLGIYLMRKLMNSVEFTVEDDDNVLRMRKRIALRDARVVTFAGRVDASTAAALEAAVRAAMQDGAKSIILDLHDVTFLSSSGLRTLLLLARDLRKTDGDLLLCALQPSVAEVFQITGFDQIFPLFRTREEAVTRLGTA